jgi:DNA-3-methyladenine glycosylase
MALRWSTAESFSRPVERPLGRAFFDRTTTRVARDLLGSVLHVRGRTGRRSVRIVEVEAYGPDDPASHAYRGPTVRNRSMFGPPGTLYMYRIHQVVCANLVTRRGEAVLLRAGAPLDPAAGNPSGPGRLCRYLGLEWRDDGLDVTRVGRVYLTRDQSGNPRLPILRGRRVGISRAVERPFRFSVAGSPWVSRPRPPRLLSAASPSRSHDGAGSRRTRTRSTPLSDGGRSGGRTVGR